MSRRDEFKSWLDTIDGEQVLDSAVFGNLCDEDYAEMQEEFGLSRDSINSCIDEVLNDD